MEAGLCKLPLNIMDFFFCLGPFLSPGPINRLLQKQGKLFHSHFSEIVLCHYCFVLLCPGIIPDWNMSWLQWCFSSFVLPVSNSMDTCWPLPPAVLHSSSQSFSAVPAWELATFLSRLRVNSSKPPCWLPATAPRDLLFLFPFFLLDKNKRMWELVSGFGG